MSEEDSKFIIVKMFLENNTVNGFAQSFLTNYLGVPDKELSQKRLERIKEGGLIEKLRHLYKYVIINTEFERIDEKGTVLVHFRGIPRKEVIIPMEIETEEEMLKFLLK